MLCDFCSNPCPQWEYPAATFTAYEVGGLMGQSVGSWAACWRCHDLIEAHDREGLARRAVDELGVKDERMRAVILVCLRDLHHRFFANRLGPGKLVDDGVGEPG